MLVFPNFSEQPVFAEPGKSVSISADASHLKQMEVKGTKDNELMTQFRERCLQATPPETKKYAEEFISDNPDSPVSVYLVFRHFMQQPDADFARAAACSPSLPPSNRVMPGWENCATRLNAPTN